MSSSQKGLRLVGTLELVFGIAYFLFIFVIDKNQQIGYIVSGAFSVIFGICILMAAVNANLYKPAWYLGILNVILAVIGLIGAVIQKSGSHLFLTTIMELCFGVIILTYLYKVKGQNKRS